MGQERFDRAWRLQSTPSHGDGAAGEAGRVMGGGTATDVAAVRLRTEFLHHLLLQRLCGFVIGQITPVPMAEARGWWSRARLRAQGEGSDHHREHDRCGTPIHRLNATPACAKLATPRAETARTFG
jgi:hypothetical protein